MIRPVPVKTIVLGSGTAVVGVVGVENARVTRVAPQAGVGSWIPNRLSAPIPLPTNSATTVGWANSPSPGAPRNVPVNVNGATMVAEAAVTGGGVNVSLTNATLT